ncbi:VOC family protein [Kribbella sp. NPDC050459]|jgi:predicted enzyme related to lactoylglutathione lyase|uniref:VOC family protein n=1 Tax=unclassified Kribbella TaxID=2644121 RepID=UPI002FAEF2B7
MSTPAPGTLAWFEVASDDPETAEKFYGGLFNWSFESSGSLTSGGLDYRNITAQGAQQPMGGLFATNGELPNHAVFYILVADVETTCAEAEQLGGTVVNKRIGTGGGTPDFAYLRDPSGSQFAVFTPRPE